MKKLLLGTLLLLPTLALARIGETLDQCQLRYGVMLRVNVGDGKFHPEYPQYCYQMGDIEIRVRLYNGVSAEEVFFAADNTKKLTGLQKQQIRGANEDSGKTVIWTEIDKYGIFAVTTEEFYKILHSDKTGGF